MYKIDLLLNVSILEYFTVEESREKSKDYTKLG